MMAIPANVVVEGNLSFLPFIILIWGHWQRAEERLIELFEERVSAARQFSEWTQIQRFKELPDGCIRLIQGEKLWAWRRRARIQR